MAMSPGAHVLAARFERIRRDRRAAAVIVERQQRRGAHQPISGAWSIALAPSMKWFGASTCVA
jgi:hypothetical protein